jgi:hypothetical protein
MNVYVITNNSKDHTTMYVILIKKEELKYYSVNSLNKAILTYLI